MDIIGSILAILLLYLIIKWGLILIAVVLGIYIIVAIIRAITNAVNKHSDLGVDISEYNNSDSVPYDDYAEGMDDYSDAIEVEVTTVSNEEDERIYEPYTCPECGEPYDGIYCELCGHSNETPGYEEESETDQWFENMTAMAMFDAEEERLEAEREERESLMFGSDMEDEEDEDFF